LRDLRKYTQQTNTRLAIGALLLIFIVGDGLIYYFYGQGAALLGFVCLIGGLLPVVLIIGVLWLMEWIVKRANRE
jgi:hypothetical protein